MDQYIYINWRAFFPNLSVGNGKKVYIKKESRSIKLNIIIDAYKRCLFKFQDFFNSIIFQKKDLEKFRVWVMKKSQIKNRKNEQKKKGGQNSDVNESEGEEKVKVEDGVVVKTEVKLENPQGPKKWYEMKNLQVDDDKKWDYLEHHGVTFPDPYIPKKIKALYDGDEVSLNAFEEQLAWYWCQSLGTEWAANPIYQKNFQTQFMERFLKQKTKYTDFKKFDFNNIKISMEKLKEDRKNRTQEQKRKQKQRKDQITRNHCYAIVDDMVEKINGPQIEPPTLFKGRGAHPKAGYLKSRVQPEQITLNLARDAPIPKCPLAGHAWGAIVCKQDSTWLCSYKTDSIATSSHHKYIFLAANSKFKGMNDMKKYEKARVLKQKIKDIREDYFKKIEDKDMRNRQLGVATYLIDTLALRAGNEKDSEEEADTVGCCSLRVQHIEILPNNQIKLDFLGKDSMRYQNTVTVRPEVWKAIEGFLKNKKPEEDLFDKIDAQALNDYLKSMMEGLTAKVFRTYNASFTLQNQLKKVNLKGKTMEEKVDVYDEANKQVAILCNHQKTVSKKQVESLKTKQKSIQVLKQYLKELEKHKSQFSAKRERIEREPETVKIEGAKQFTKKFPDNKDATISLIKKTQQKVIREQKNLKKKEDNKQIATGTSKTNYNDPRISVAWCKANEVRIQLVFPKTLLSKFVWAMYSDKDFQF